MNNLVSNNTINLTLAYTDSNGESLKYEGTATINLKSFSDTDLPSHQIVLSKVNFEGLNIINAILKIQPQYNIIYIKIKSGQLYDSSGQPITNINIRINIDEEPIVYSPINSDFIGNDIARFSQIPNTTSQLDNDSGFVTSAALTGYATTSDVSTAISNQTKETWTFTLSDGSTVTKSIVLGA